VTKELFVLLVRIPVKAGFEDEYLSLINAVVDEMRHEASFVNAVVHRSTEDPTVFYSTRRGSGEMNFSQCSR
jgi:quinol monooxygenase YgiN